MKARVHLVIDGHVQGVSFRYYTTRLALALGLGGWVRNRPDGRVEVVAEGEQDAVGALAEWCRHGPSGARVDGIEAEPEEYEGGFEGFRIVG